MNKLLIAIILCIFLVFAYWFVTMPEKTTNYLLPNEQIKQIIVQKTNNIAIQEIDNLTKESAKVKSIYIKSMPIRFQRGSLTTKVYGKLALEKEKNFRLIITHLLTGKEMDIGSNEDVFWFWSKRMKPPALNYSKWESSQNTSLRIALNPNWFLEILNFNYVATENAEVIEHQDKYAVIQNRNSQVKSIILVDPKEKCVLGKYIYENEIMLASCEYFDFLDRIPQKICIFWYEEDIKMTWDLSDAKINEPIDVKFWRMPSIKNKVDISN